MQKLSALADEFIELNADPFVGLAKRDSGDRKYQ